MRKKIKIFLTIFLVIAAAVPSQAVFGAANQKSDFRIALENGRYLVRIQGESQIQEVGRDVLENWLADSSVKVEYYEPDFTYQAAYIPTDTSYSELWALTKIKAPQAWDITKGKAEVTIAILDSGVDVDHPDLKSNIWVNQDEIPGDKIDNDNNGYIDDVNGWDFVTNSFDPNPKFNSSASDNTLAGMDHGTIIAGIAAAIGDNNGGVAGVTWKSKIMPLRVLNSLGEGSTSAVIKAIEYAIEKKADIINMSFVGSNKSELLEEAIKKAWDAGLILVAAAGKDSAHNGEGGENLDQFPAYPVCHDGENNMVIGVAAVDNNDQKATFSNYGQKYIDISAPGTKIYSTLFYHPDDTNFKDYYGGYWSGTSVAAPLVAGTAALIKSINPHLTNTQIRDILMKNSDNIEAVNLDYQGKLGGGRLNAYQAVRAAFLDMSVLLPDSKNIVVGAGFGGGPQIRVLRTDGTPITSFFAYDSKFRGGVNVAAGDVNGDGKDEIVAGAGNGGGPQVRVFDMQGNLISQFLAYDSKFRGGVNVTVGDVNGDGIGEIITGAGNGGGPHIRIFNYDGTLLSHFFAYDQKFRGGVNVSAGDIDGDGVREIITGPADKGGPQVRVFDYKGNVKLQFFALENKDFRGGVKARAAGDVDGDGKIEIAAVISTKGEKPMVRFFSHMGGLKSQFLAYNESFTNGINIAVSDVDNNGNNDIIVGPVGGAEPQVRIFNYLGTPRAQFLAYAKTFLGGVNVAAIKK